MKLVIVESPAKAKTIEKYLGKGYKVVASMGHIVDLPKSQLGIEVDKNFKPIYEVTKKKVLQKIKKQMKSADSLILAVDMDREGEAIGWHIARQLKLINDKGVINKKGKGLMRIVFTEITKAAIQNAVKTPRSIDMDKVNAQQARRVLDRLVGYELSPLLWKKIRYGLSAGRVQSAALRIIVDRELERQAFRSDEYWSMAAFLSIKENSTKVNVRYVLQGEEKMQENLDLLRFNLNKINDKKVELSNQEAVEEIVSETKHKVWEVDSVKSKDVKRSPKSPFITSTLQREAGNRLSMSAKQAMRTAQSLYEAGLITYMRTDSLMIAASAIRNIRKFITNEFGVKYIPKQERVFLKKSKLSQEAHEAIRPTDISRQPTHLKLDARQKKLYTLIWNRTIASQMTDAKLSSTTVTCKIKQYSFQLSGQKIIFPGYLKVYTDQIKENLIPAIEVGQKLYLDNLEGDQHFTMPPPKYTEASLIKALEAYGIGRPSTYAPIISTIQSRKYVEKEGRYLNPTDTGMVVTKLLKNHFSNIVDFEFTASIEEDLDTIAKGNEQWRQMIADFYFPFKKKLISEEKKIGRDDYTKLGDSDKKCPNCKKKMIIKLGRYGRFLSCADFPKCKGMLSMDGKSSADIEKEATTEEFKKKYKNSPKTKDKRDFVLKKGRYGLFWAHPDYPKVKEAKPLELQSKICRKIYGKAPLTKDGKKMKLRAGRFGEFWAHPDYPKVKEVAKIDKKEVAAKKKELGIE